jgi:cell wall-associated NlpC family hydrolase
MTELWQTTILSLIGLPFRWGGRGPDAYDCWGLVSACLQSLDLPVPPDLMAPTDTEEDTTKTIEQEIASQRWLRVNPPRPGDVAAMSSHTRIHHLGLFTPWGVLHTSNKSRAILSSEAQLRRMGYRRMEYYRWAG